ncbi:rhamnogalacturonan lyase family protein [Paenibacillus kribbensis]|uniref:rhamnogalacturonan lyase family protein n=1 Tax=Paenibacillus kribbensis TaxID=172713 RepID=UPI0008398626|nr:hypothetical protein [Paenibacillus kribbensis]
MKSKWLKVWLSAVLALAVPSGVASDVAQAEEGQAQNGSGPRLVEYLNRGLVAVHAGEGKIFVSWRLLDTEANSVSFDVYRRTAEEPAIRLNEQPLREGTHYTDEGADPGQKQVYFVKSYNNGQWVDTSEEFVLPADSPERQYFSIPLRQITSNPGDYFVQHGWPGDLDGDGTYEYIVTRIPVKDGNRLVEAYSLDKGWLWSIDMGPYSVKTIDTYNAPPASVSEYGVPGLGGWRDTDNVTVGDLDGDGRAEVLIRTFAGVRFADGAVIAESAQPVQYISVVNGEHGYETTRVPVPNDHIQHGPLSGHFGIGYVDGVHPSLIAAFKNRGTDRVFRYVTTAYDYAGGKLNERWKHVGADGEFFHQIRILDLDGDGKDEVSFGGWALDDDGSTLYSLPGVVHGDRFHITDLDPDRPGLEQFGIQQAENGHVNQFPWFYADASNGRMIRTGQPPQDVARGTAADIDPRHRGYELWSSAGGVYNVNGEEISTAKPTENFKIWWDGDALGELLDKNFVDKWDYEQGRSVRLFTAEGIRVNSRNAPVLYGDLFGDWREEVVYESADFTELRIYTTIIPSRLRLYTLLHNPAYRNTLSVKGYMQSTLVDYYLGDGMSAPPAPPITPVTAAVYRDEN